MSGRNDVYNLNHESPAMHQVRLGDKLKQLITLGNELRDAFVTEDKLIAGMPGCQEGVDTNTMIRVVGPIRYQSGGQVYSSPAAEGVLDGDGHDITATKFGAWRIQISATGAVTTTASNGGGADMAYESLELALLALSTQALVTNTVVVGYLGIEAAAGGFTIGTDLPVTSDAQVTAATYYDESGDSGLIAAATGAVSATPEEMNIGASTIKKNGLQLAEIAADTTLPFPLADTITTLLWGAWLIVSDLAGTAHYIQSVDGDTAASLMAYADYAAAKTAADALIAAMPGLFIVLGVLYIHNGAKDPWTAITDDITDGSDVTESIFNMRLVGEGIQVIDAAVVGDITGVVGD